MNDSSRTRHELQLRRWGTFSKKHQITLRDTWFRCVTTMLTHRAVPFGDVGTTRWPVHTRCDLRRVLGVMNVAASAIRSHDSRRVTAASMTTVTVSEMTGNRSANSV